jgi:membrane-associated PAP2 superfamily phosphatase
MNRTGLLIAIAVAAVVGLAFGLYPKLDLLTIEPFFDPATKLWIGSSPPWSQIRTAASWLIALIAAPAFIALAVKLLLPRRPMLLPGRAAVLMVVTLGLAPGLLTNVILKDNWARSRPFYVTEFGGDDPFLPWWDPRGECPKNCSFVAGEPSGAFWTLAPAAVTPPHWRALAYVGALAFGSAIGLLRMAGGGHFFSDVVFSGVFTFLVIWLVHGWLYRWRATAITAAAVERALEAAVMPVCRTVAWLMARLRGK